MKHLVLVLLVVGCGGGIRVGASCEDVLPMPPPGGQPFVIDACAGGREWVQCCWRPVRAHYDPLSDGGFAGFADCLPDGTWQVVRSCPAGCNRDEGARPLSCN